MVSKKGNNKITYIENLIENLNHDNPNIRRESVLALEKNGDSEALIALLNTYFRGSSYLIPKIIGKIGTNKIKLLLKIASNKDEKLRVRQYAIEGLGKIGDKKILKDLLELLKDDNIYIKKSVILALADVGDNYSVEPLLNLLQKEDDWIKKYILWTLGIIGDNRCVDKLINLLSNKNLEYNIKKNIVIALGIIGDKRAVKILIEILKDQIFSNLKEYSSIALSKIIEKNALYPIIEKSFNPIWRLKEHYEKILDKLAPQLKDLLKYEYKILRKLPSHKVIEQIENPDGWYYGYLNKSHYILNSFDKIVGCLNLILLLVYNDTYIFYFDTIEIKEDYKRKGLGTKLVEFMIKNDIEKYKKFHIFLLVAKCEQYKLKFFSTLGFNPIKLRKTKVGTHCIMSYPFNENSEENCQKLFEFFNWREEKKEFISSDCKYAYNPNPTGLYWCSKKKIYISGLEKQTCQFYTKEKELYFKDKFLDLKEQLS